MVNMRFWKRLLAAVWGGLQGAGQASLTDLFAIKMILTPHARRHANVLDCALKRIAHGSSTASQYRFPIYEVGEPDGCPYLSNEFVDGIGLDEKIGVAAHRAGGRGAIRKHSPVQCTRASEWHYPPGL